MSYAQLMPSDSGQLRWRFILHINIIMILFLFFPLAQSQRLENCKLLMAFVELYARGEKITVRLRKCSETQSHFHSAKIWIFFTLLDFHVNLLSLPLHSSLTLTQHSIPSDSTLLSLPHHSSFTPTPLFFHSNSTLLSLCLSPLFIHSNSALLSLPLHSSFTPTPLFFHSHFTLLSLPYHSSFTRIPLFFHSHSTLLSLPLYSSFTSTPLLSFPLHSYFTPTPTLRSFSPTPLFFHSHFTLLSLPLHSSFTPLFFHSKSSLEFIFSLFRCSC